MVAVKVTQDDAEERRVGTVESPDGRERQLSWLSVERKSEVEEESVSRRLQLDTGTADLGGTAVDTGSHGHR